MNHLPPPQPRKVRGPQRLPLPEAQSGGVLGGVVPQLGVSERVGIPALPLAEDFPVHPAGAGFRFPQRKLFPAFGHSESPADSSRGGGTGV